MPWFTPSRVAAAEPPIASRRPGAVTDTTTPTSPLARFEALFAAHQRDILAYAMRRSGTITDAEDVAAKTFAIAWRKLAAIPEEPLPWLYATARRVLANQRRGDRGWPVAGAGVASGPGRR